MAEYGVGRVERLLEGLSIAMVVLSGDGRVVWQNGAMERLTGVGLEQARGMDVLCLYEKGFKGLMRGWRGFKGMLKAAHSEGTSIDCLECVLGRGGRARRLLFWSEPSTDGGARVEYFVDITGYGAMKGLDGGEDIFTQIALNAPDAIITLDREARVVFWNPSAERMFGYSSIEARGRRLYELIIPEDLRADFQKGFKRFVATGRGAFIGKTVETRGLRKDGTELSVELSITGIKRDGQWLGFGIVRDITRRIQLASELSQKVEDLERMNSIMVGRELRMAELRREILRLRKRIDELEGTGQRNR